MRVKISRARAGWHGQLEGFHANVGLLSMHMRNLSRGIYLADLMLGKCMVFWDGCVMMGCLVLSTLARGWSLKDKRDEGHGFHGQGRWAWLG